jgi:class 3 adenylate cyclase
MLELGVGIHHGPVCVGNIKGEERDQYTAIGPAVNFAQRIESRAGGEIDDSEKDRITRRLKDRDAHLTLLKEFHFRDSVLASQAVYRLLNEEEDAQKRLRPNPCLVDIKGIDGVFPVYGIANAILFPP